MSTTFGVLINPYTIEDFRNAEANDESTNHIIVPVAFMYNGGGASWITPLASMLSDDIPVIPMDNDRSDIFTIGDIKKEINS